MVFRPKSGGILLVTLHRFYIKLHLIHGLTLLAPRQNTGPLDGFICSVNPINHLISLLHFDRYVFSIPSTKSWLESIAPRSCTVLSTNFVPCPCSPISRTVAPRTAFFWSLIIVGRFKLCVTSTPETRDCGEAYRFRWILKRPSMQ